LLEPLGTAVEPRHAEGALRDAVKEDDVMSVVRPVQLAEEDRHSLNDVGATLATGVTEIEPPLHVDQPLTLVGALGIAGPDLVFVEPVPVAELLLSEEERFAATDRLPPIAERAAHHELLGLATPHVGGAPRAHVGRVEAEAADEITGGDGRLVVVGAREGDRVVGGAEVFGGVEVGDRRGVAHEDDGEGRHGAACSEVGRGGKRDFPGGGSFAEQETGNRQRATGNGRSGRQSARTSGHQAKAHSLLPVACRLSPVAALGSSSSDPRTASAEISRGTRRRMGAVIVRAGVMSDDRTGDVHRGREELMQPGHRTDTRGVNGRPREGGNMTPGVRQ
jgi:hypothetical protein